MCPSRSRGIGRLGNQHSRELLGAWPSSPTPPTDVCGWTVGWIIKRYRNLVLATKKNSSRISLYDICFCEPISYSSYDIPRRENAHENTLPQLYVSHNCPSTTFIMSGSAQPVFTSMQLWREKTGCT